MEPAAKEQRCPYRAICSKSDGKCIPPRPVSFAKEPECYAPVAEEKRQEVRSFKKSYQERRWKELQQITWGDVFSFREKLMYILLIITIVTFIVVFAAFLKMAANLPKP